MAKFSKDFKFKLIQEYLSTPIGTHLLARKYKVGSQTTVLKWINQFQKYGIEGLEVRSHKYVYDGDFKANVLRWMKENNASLPKTALHFNISEPSTIWLWERKFEAQGINALYTSRGRPSIMNEKKQVKKTNKSEVDRLKEENELLRIENDYLKKLRALVQSKPDKKRK